VVRSQRSDYSFTERCHCCRQPCGRNFHARGDRSNHDQLVRRATRCMPAVRLLECPTLQKDANAVSMIRKVVAEIHFCV
jgi:hypothetical protein